MPPGSTDSNDYLHRNFEESDDEVPPDYYDVTELYSSLDEVEDNHDEVILSDGELYVSGEEVDWDQVDEEFFGIPEREVGAKTLYAKCVGSVAGFTAAAAGLKYGNTFLAASGTAIGTASLASAAEQVLEE